MGDPDHARFLAVFAFVVLTLAVVSGQILAGRQAPAGRRPALFRLHRASSIVGLAMALAHGLDRWSAASGAQAALGLVALVAAAAPVAAWLGRRHLASRWRLVHRAAYLAFVAAVLHAAVFHSPGMPLAETVLYGSSVAAVVGLAVRRQALAAAWRFSPDE